MGYGQSELNRFIDEPSASQERARRRRFSRLRKLAILAEVERCPAPEQVMALLAREGLHGSQLTLWRKQFENSKVTGLKEPGARTARVAELSRTIGQLEQQKAELQRQLHVARLLLALRCNATRAPLMLPAVATTR